MATIAITRRTGAFGAFSKMKVSLDEQEIGVVSNNTEEIFEAPPGVHLLSVKMSGSYAAEPVEFQVGEGETRHFEIRLSGIAQWYMPVMIVFLLGILSRFILPEGLGQPVLQLLISVAALVYVIVVFSQRGRFFVVSEQ